MTTVRGLAQASHLPCCVTAASHRRLRNVKPQALHSAQCSTAVFSSIDRRCVISLLPASVLPLLVPSVADANPISEFLRSRQRDNGGFKMLAPIKVAQSRLQEAAALLGNESRDGVELALNKVRSSSLNCYIFDAQPEDSFETKVSLWTQQMKMSDPCTFRIILKNVTSFSPTEVQDEADAMLNELILSYQKLDTYLEEARDGNSDKLLRAKDQIQATLQTAASIEGLVKSVLDIA